MHGQLKDILDDAINEVIGKDQVQLIFEGAIARTYLLQGADGRRRFLKIQDINSCEPLEIQKQRLEWLKDKLSVPRVFYYEKIKDKEYMITAEVPGYDGASSSCKAALPDVIVAIAEGLRVIHSISTVACPYDNSLEKQLVIAEKTFMEGRLIRRSC